MLECQHEYVLKVGQLDKTQNEKWVWLIFEHYVKMLTWTCLFSQHFNLNLKSILYEISSNDDVTLLSIQMLTVQLLTIF